MQGNQVSILDCDKVKLTNSDLDSDRDDEEDSYRDDEEIIETSHFVTQDHNQHIVASSLIKYEGIFHLDSQQESYKMNQQYEENLYTPLFEINEDIQQPCESFRGKEDNHYLRKKKQKVLSPLSEDEIRSCYSPS